MLDSNPILRRNLKNRVKKIVTLIDLKNIESYQACIDFFYNQICSSMCTKNEYNFTTIFKNNDGNTPLSRAYFDGKTETVKFLTESSAKVPDLELETVKKWCSENNYLLYKPID